MGERPPMTPVPYKKLMPLAIIYFIEAFVFTNIFSYVGYMVYDFHLTDDPDKVGYYAGYIGSVFSIAGFLSSFWWGRISDRYGRRPVLLFGTFGGCVSTLLFGFSTSLWMALACRFAAGLLNGNVGVVKGYAADICDKTNQAKGVGVMQLGWGLGGILGPLFGGILSRPCDNFAGMCGPGNLFYTYPYLLPNLISVFAGVIAIISLCLFLPKEEPKKPKKVEMEDLKSLNSLEFSFDESDPDLDSEVSVDDNGEYLEKGLQDRERLFSRKYKVGFFQRMLGKIEKDSIFRNKVAMLSVTAYCLLGTSFTMFDEAFPLFALSEVSSGGLKFSLKDIGYVGAINGGSAVFIQIFFYYPVTVRLGFTRCFRLGLMIGTLLFFNYPSLHFFLNNTVGLWAAVSVITFLKVVVGQLAFSSVTAMISNACPLTQVGSINGFAQSCVSLPRAFSPAIAGNLLAWGFSNGLGFPFNQYLCFITISVCIGSALICSLWLPKTLDYPYEPTLLPNKEEATTEDKEERVEFFSVE